MVVYENETRVEVKAKEQMPKRGGRPPAERPRSRRLLPQPAQLFFNGLDWRLQPWARRETILIYPV
jgi:hypothetical protein